jgi:hypothetical protein
MTSFRPTRREAAADVAVVVGLSGAYVAAALAGAPHGLVIPAVAGALLAYAGLVLARRGESPRDFGLAAPDMRRARPALAFTAIAAAALVLVGLATGRDLWRQEMAVLLPLYPLWGVVQQLIFQGVLHRRLATLLGPGWLPALLTAVFFAAVHAGDAKLVGLTLVAGVAWSFLFQLYPNVWILGLSHGILAALAYPLAVGKNPLLEL